MSELDSAKYWYKELVEGLRLMASEYHVQKESLPTFVHLPDEVLNALVIESFPTMLEHRLINKHQFEVLTNFYNHLDEIELPEDYDEMLQSLKSGEQFQNIRVQALKMLESLGFNLEKPRISAVYVKGS